MASKSQYLSTVSKQPELYSDIANIITDYGYSRYHVTLVEQTADEKEEKVIYSDQPMELEEIVAYVEHTLGEFTGADGWKFQHNIDEPLEVYGNNIVGRHHGTNIHPMLIIKGSESDLAELADALEESELNVE